MRLRIQWFLALSVLAIPFSGECCEPIVPLYKLLSGSSLAGPAILTQSIWWLLGAVAIKTIAFILLERRLSWMQATFYMIFANVLSTIPGVLIAGLTSSMSGMIIVLPIVWVLGMMLDRRFSFLPHAPQSRWFAVISAPLWFLIFFLVSVGLFGFASAALDTHSFRLYWFLKFLFVTMVAASGILMSALLEECVIARMTRKRDAGLSFFTSVFRANYITLGIVLAVVAVQMLPKRLNAPHFIVFWLQSISAIFG